MGKEMKNPWKLLWSPTIIAEMFVLAKPVNFTYTAGEDYFVEFLTGVIVGKFGSLRIILKTEEKRLRNARSVRSGNGVVHVKMFNLESIRKQMWHVGLFLPH